MPLTDIASSSKFKFQSKNVFLTYPRCTLGTNVLGMHLWQLLETYGVRYVHVNLEHHKDGAPHLHALAQTNQRMRTSDPRFFDLCDFHPNIQPARDPQAVLDYIEKRGGDCFNKGIFRPRGYKSGRSTVRSSHGPSFGPPGNRPSLSDSEMGSGGSSDAAGTLAGRTRDVLERLSPKDQVMANILRRCTTRQEYMNEVKKCFPYDFCTRLQAWEYSASKLYPDPPVIYHSSYDDSAFTCHESISDWVRDNIYYVDPEKRPLSLYICGPTRTGKTSWARSLGRHNYYQNNVDFSNYDEHACYNIIDDIPFKFCPCWKALVGAQKDFTVNPKYGKKKRIAGGIACIILVNDDEDWATAMTPQQLSYMESNCMLYYLSEGETFINNAPDNGSIGQGLESAVGSLS